MKKLVCIIFAALFPVFSFALAKVSLPVISAENASGLKVVIPDPRIYSPCLYIYTFSKPKEGLTETYIKAYRDIFGQDSLYYQIAVFGPVPLFEGFIKDAIKNNTKPENRSSMILYFGNKQILMQHLQENINDSLQWYIVAENGEIVKSRSTGGQFESSDADFKEMKEAYKIISEVKNGKR